MLSYILMHYFRAIMREAAGLGNPGGGYIIPRKVLKFELLYPAFWRLLGSENGRRIRREDNPRVPRHHSDREEHCSIAKKFGKAVADFAPSVPTLVPFPSYKILASPFLFLLRVVLFIRPHRIHSIDAADVTRSVVCACVCVLGTRIS